MYSLLKKIDIQISVSRSVDVGIPDSSFHNTSNMLLIFGLLWQVFISEIAAGDSIKPVFGLSTQSIIAN